MTDMHVTKSKENKSTGRKLIKKMWVLKDASVMLAFCRKVVEKLLELKETYDG